MIDLFLRAIGEKLPDQVPAGHHGAFWGITLAGQYDNGEYWTYLVGANGGFGASAGADGFGPLRTLMHGDNPDIPMEMIEAQYPVRFHCHRILREAGGAGLHRGGAGLDRVVEVLEEAQLSTYIDRTVNPAWGLGGRARTASLHLRPAARSRRADPVGQDTSDSGARRHHGLPPRWRRRRMGRPGRMNSAFPEQPQQLTQTRGVQT
jgi:N-methylhydantoinase B/oxoprolinase/acetone carboxylase alpha subunit